MDNSAAAPPWAQHPGPQQTPADQQQAGPYAALYGRARQPVPANHEQQPGLPAADAQQASHWGQGWQADHSQAVQAQPVWADGGQPWPQQVRVHT